ncbi:MAG: hypothetical protein IKM29_02065 [Clostridia bacterium]|nr:hypothetical protein [Clostridia bacterium]
MENEKKTSNKKGLAIASMALGIFSIIGTSGELLGIAAAVISLLFVRQLKKDGIESTFATVGKITSCIGIVVRLANVITSIFAVVFVIGIYFIWFLVVILAALLGSADPGIAYEFGEFASNVSMMF